MLSWLTQALWGADVDPTEIGVAGEEPLDEEAFLRSDAANGALATWPGTASVADEEITAPQHWGNLKHRLARPR